MRHALLCSLALATACGIPTENLAPATDLPVVPAPLVQATIGGTPTSQYPGVVYIYFDGAACTASVIAPRVLLTAAHCVDHVAGTAKVAEGLAVFGEKAESPTATIETLDARMHRYYSDFYKFDIALVHLAEDAPTDPVPFNTESLEGVLEVNDTVLAVGYGVSNAETQTGGGQKRKVEIPVLGLAKGHIIIGTEDKNVCFGDSGGPHLVNIDGVDTIVAVSSFVTDNCHGTSQHSRVDAYLQDFVYPTLDRWDGPCKEDGTCVETGCRTPDPDCDPCGYNDECGTDCPALDLDCPIDGIFRETCVADTECELRRCVTSMKDPEEKFCTQPCDPATAAADCGSGMECIPLEETGTETVCSFRAAPLDDTEDDGGCGCRVAPSGGNGLAGALVACALAALCLVRRRRL